MAYNMSINVVLLVLQIVCTSAGNQVTVSCLMIRNIGYDKIGLVSPCIQFLT